MDQTTFGGSSVFYQIDFSIASYANIYFRDAEEAEILFSVCCRRQTEGMFRLQANACRGGKWLRPTQAYVEAEGDVHALRILFEDDVVRVEVNGTEQLLCAEAYPDLDMRRVVELRGAIDPDALQLPPGLQLPQRGVGELRLRDMFRLSGWAFLPGTKAVTHRVTVTGLAEDLAHVTRSDPQQAERLGAASEMIAVEAVVPGRAWLSPAASEFLQIRLWCNGVCCGAPLLIHRADVVAGIEALALSGSPEKAIFQAVTAVEHVKFGGFWPTLSATAQAFIRRTVETFKLQDFFSEALEMPAVGEPARDAAPT
ncbi:hypothetical protein, partial [Cereibacter sphaeroides]|uniref:hypothetical protein n=1 Tax=Cereibacter sphaeroides TaxID=1063 RepID=UPI001F409131